MPKITLRIPDEWADRLATLCQERGIDPAPSRGTSGGIPLLIRQLVARELGEEVEDYHAQRSEHWAAEADKRAGRVRFAVVDTETGRVEAVVDERAAAFVKAHALERQSGSRKWKLRHRVVPFGERQGVVPGWYYLENKFQKRSGL